MSAQRPPRGSWISRLVLRLLAWLIPVTVAWLALTPVYNNILRIGGERLVRLTEHPPVTRLERYDTHHLLITRSDIPTSQGSLSSIRTTDLHFDLILLAALFLAVPGEPLRTRFANLGWAALISVAFHLVLVVFWVKFVYATQLGTWSLEHYGPFGRNFWGLGKHLLDLPFKFALPLILWSYFYLGRLIATGGD
jgi:hypothetical protein